MRIVLPVHLVPGAVGHRRNPREGSLCLGVEYRCQRHAEREYDKYGYVFPIEFLHCGNWPFRGRTGPPSYPRERAESIHAGSILVSPRKYTANFGNAAVASHFDHCFPAALGTLIVKSKGPKYMRWNNCLIMTAFAALLSSSPSVAASFGTVVPIGGHTADIALDESRGVLYIANFTANRIEVMSTADYSIHTSMNVAPQPGALSLSPDSKYLLVAHYGNVTPTDPSKNAITLINLNDNSRQTFSTGDTPLGLAFLADGTAFIVTNNGILLFDPISGAMQTLSTFAALAKTLPAAPDTFPAQVISAALSTSPDRTFVYGIADSGSAQAFYYFDARRGQLNGYIMVAAPKPLPRVSVAADGSWALIGQYRMDGTANYLAQFPNSAASVNTGGNAIDSKNGIIYAQIPTASSTTSTGSSPTSPAVQTAPPVLSILDAENLLVRESFSIPENITGRSVLSAAADVLYTASDSGVMIFPVGRLNQQHRLAASVRDVVARGTFCNRNVITQNIAVTDPGGGNTDFQLSTDTQGVTISPSSGITPAVVQVRVDPTVL